MDDDADIVRASVAHPERFAAVFDRHHRRIWAYLARSGGRQRAEDLAGDVFVAAFAQRDRYDPARGSVVAWLYGIALNLNRTANRRHARAGRALARLGGRRPVATTSRSPDDAADAVGDGQRLARVRAALESLRDHERDVIVLVAWEGLSYAEVAAALGIEVGTVRSRLSRARSHLRELAGVGGEVLDGPPPQRSTITDG